MHNVFLDTSVIISATLSNAGGSFHILNDLKNNFKFQINEYVADEVKNIIKIKFLNDPILLNKNQLLMGTSNITTLKDPTKREILEVEKYISQKDQPILASAIKHSNYLLTLDNEFFKDKILDLALKKSLVILKPKGFIEIFR